MQYGSELEYYGLQGETNNVFFIVCQWICKYQTHVKYHTNIGCVRM